MECVYDREAASSSAGGGNFPSTNPTGSIGAQQQPTQPAQPGSLSPNPASLASETKGRRRRELFLYHLYTIDVAPTLPGAYQPAYLKQWTVDLPRLALDYEPLHNMLVVISLHWMICADLHPEGDLFVDSLAAYRAKYLEAVLQEHRKALAHMDHRNADTASFTSILLCVDAFASLRDRDQDIIPYRPPTEWLQMCKGVRSVVGDALEMAKNMSHSRLREMADTTVPFWEPSLIYNEANRSKFSYLLVRRDVDKESNEENDTYGMAVSYIGALLTAQEAGEQKAQIARRTIIFPMLVPQMFIESVAMRRPRALIIIAHFFALATASSHVWWIGGSPAREVRYIYDYLGPEWHDMMQWPMQILTRTPSQNSSHSQDSSVVDSSH